MAKCSFGGIPLQYNPEQVIYRKTVRYNERDKIVDDGISFLDFKGRTGYRVSFAFYLVRDIEAKIEPEIIYKKLESFTDAESGYASPKIGLFVFGSDIYNCVITELQKIDTSRDSAGHIDILKGRITLREYRLIDTSRTIIQKRGRREYIVLEKNTLREIAQETLNNENLYYILNLFNPTIMTQNLLIKKGEKLLIPSYDEYSKFIEEEEGLPEWRR